jgi:DNA-binding GntR family transcriptional regulator
MQYATKFEPPSATLTEQLTEMIRRDIVRNVLLAGARVTEEALAERYGASRTPVREALRVLTQEALFAYTPRSGYLVLSVNLDEMDDLYAVRVAIEEKAASRLAVADARPILENLLTYWDDMPSDVAGGDVNLVFLDEQFHEALAAAGGSTVLPPMLRNINHRLHALRIRDFVDPERVRQTFEQHAAILRSLLDGDTRTARALLRAHIWQSYAFVRSRVSDTEAAPL